MKLVSFRNQGRERAGVIVDTAHSATLVIDAAVLLGNQAASPAGVSMLDLLDDWDEAGPALEEAAARGVPSEGVWRLDEVELFAPLPRPRHLTCVGLNYHDHAKESGAEPPDEPLLFDKHSSCVVGPDAPIVLPPVSNEVDFEAELGVVIGRGGRDISEDAALEHVAGFTCCNDVSARDWQQRASQWTPSKSFATFGPVGPWIVTSPEVGDPQTLDIALRLNGETMQHSNTADMIFSCAEIVSYISRIWELEPGDVISTGTPAGVGFTRQPPVLLKDGDVVEIDIERIGVLRNPVVSAASGHHGGPAAEAPTGTR